MTLSNHDKPFVADLQINFATKVEKFLNSVNQWIKADGNKYFGGGLEFHITDGVRDIYTQAGLFSQGRRWEPRTRTWLKIGLTVTPVLMSMHVKGLAIDATVFRGGKPFWPDPRSKDTLAALEARAFWDDVAHLAEFHGLRAGATFSDPDYPHFEENHNG